MYVGLAGLPVFHSPHMFPGSYAGLGHMFGIGIHMSAPSSSLGRSTLYFFSTTRSFMTVTVLLPSFATLPARIQGLTPSTGSTSSFKAASCSTVTTSSNVQRLSAEHSDRFNPWRVSGVSTPRCVMASTRMPKCLLLR